MIILLDLNYTLVANSPKRGITPPPMAVRLRTERYRQWLVELVRPHPVILITARPNRWREPTLARIFQETAWQPQEAFFAELGFGGPPGIKRRILMAHVFPRHGRNAHYLAIESNPRTRAMYARLGIMAVPIGNRPWTRLPTRRVRGA
ncbi:MAG TPA: hypothetical protein PLU30_00245 [Verrucomicrobiae bacterium]|nr:hypothetical protein [Verrucomicrobiae bacterium]